MVHVENILGAESQKRRNGSVDNSSRLDNSKEPTSFTSLHKAALVSPSQLARIEAPDHGCRLRFAKRLELHRLYLTDTQRLPWLKAKRECAQ